MMVAQRASGTMPMRSNLPLNTNNVITSVYVSKLDGRIAHPRFWLLNSRYPTRDDSGTIRPRGPTHEDKINEERSAKRNCVSQRRAVACNLLDANASGGGPRHRGDRLAEGTRATSRWRAVLLGHRECATPLAERARASGVAHSR